MVADGALIVTVGGVLSTVNVDPLVGAAVTTFPARSVPVLKATVAVPLPAPTTYEPVYWVASTLVMGVAAAVLAPLTENCGAGTSAMASLNVAVSVNVVPCLTIPAGAYVMAAVGAVLSTVKVAPLVGVAVIRFPATSFPAPTVTVAGPSPACTVYRSV